MTDVIKIHRWTAKRSGARITIEGLMGEHGPQAEIRFSVDKIVWREGDSRLPIATSKKTGQRYELA